MLFNEPKLLKSQRKRARAPGTQVSVLFNEPKLLKLPRINKEEDTVVSFSALQRAEIAEIELVLDDERGAYGRFSALQRAEIAEIARATGAISDAARFQCSSTSRNC